MQAREWSRFGLGLALVLVGTTCGVDPGGRADDVANATRLTPLGLSSPRAWGMFDRSATSAFHPDAVPVVAILERSASIDAIKVLGPAPFTLDVLGPGGQDLGFGPIDLSTLSPGWHAFPSSSPEATSLVELRFAPVGAANGGIPELELWTTDTAAPLASVSFPARESAASIAPGACASFDVPLDRPPSSFARAHLAYDASGPLRAFALRRSVNGGLDHGGAWLAGDGTSHSFSDEIDRATVQVGPNEVRLCAPEAAPSAVAVDKLRITVELDRGRHVVAAQVGDVVVSAAAPKALGVSQELRISLDRLVAPDVIAWAEPVAEAPTVRCLDRAGTATVVRGSLLDAGTAIAVDGGALACAAITLAFTHPTVQRAVEVLGSGAVEPVDFPRLVVTSAPEHFGDRAWLGGFVERPRQLGGAIRVDVAGAPALAPALTGEFGQLVTRDASSNGPWAIDVAARLPDASVQTRHVVLDLDRRAELDQAAQGKKPALVSGAARDRFGDEGDATAVEATPGAEARIRLGTRVGVDVPRGAVTRPTRVLARHLGEGVLPPLDPGMINVTAPRGHGYEFLPHGQRFARAVDVLVPFDPALIPDGKRVEDVHTYFFDPVAEKWQRLDRSSIDLREAVLHSSTNHFTIMINAVLATPSNPSPLAFDPTTLSSIAAASPAANIDFIEPPQATSTGDARTGLPIRLPAGRGAYTPSLSISYGSGNGNSWVGIGWDVSVPRVEIDTRWGTPSYGPDADRYLLDGSELVPSTETDGPRCQDGSVGRRYRARIEGAFAHILRCVHGAAPTYHWEVHDRDGTLLVFGADQDGDPSHASLANYRNSTQVFRWNLARVVDVHANTTRFSYDVDDIAEPGKEPSREVYLASISYTSSAGLSAAYGVELVRDNHSRSDAITSARSGFKMVTRDLLRAIRVTFQGNPIREYVLTYEASTTPRATNDRIKSRLSSIRVYGVGGCSPSSNAFVPPTCSAPVFFEHRMEYYDEAQALDTPKEWTVSADPVPTRPVLGKGTTHGSSWNIGASFGTSSGNASLSAGLSSNGATRKERIGMYDLDGDGLVDQVFDIGGSLLVLYNQSRPGLTNTSPLFAPRPAGAIDGLVDLGREQSGSWGLSASASLYKAVTANAALSWGGTRARRILTDVEGDGFTDVVEGNGGYFQGGPCPTGTCFTLRSFGAPLSTIPKLDPALLEGKQVVDDLLPTADPVIQWVAPFDGTVVVSGVAQKPLAGGEDGVRVDAYHDDDLIATASIGPNDTGSFAVPSGVVVNVSAGEAIYLRVATLADDGIADDGALRDRISTSLVVRYTEACTDFGCQTVDPTAAHDPTGRPIFVFSSADDLRVAGFPGPLPIPAKGTLVLAAQLVKHPMVADARVCVQRFALGSTDLDEPCATSNGKVTPVIAAIPLAAASDAVIPLAAPIDVNTGQVLVVRVESELSFDPAAVSLAPAFPGIPAVAYTEVCPPKLDGSALECTTDPGVLAAIPLDLAHFGAYVPIGDDIPHLPFVSDRFGTLVIDSLPAPSEPFVFALRSDRQGILWQLDCLEVSCGSINPPAITVGYGESVTVELAFGSGPRSSSLLPAHFTDAPAVRVDVPGVGVPLVRPSVKSPFLGGYRQFRAAGWNEDIAFQPARLLENLLHPDPFTITQDRIREMVRSIFPPLPQYGSSAAGGVPAWFVPRSVAFVAAGSMHAAKVGLGDSGADPADHGGLFAKAYLRLSSTLEKSINVGLMPVPGFSFSIGASSSKTKTTADLVDMNGDGIADVLTPSGATLGALTLSPTGAGHASFDPGDDFREREGLEYSIGFDGQPVRRQTRSGGLTTAVDNPDGPDTGFLGLDGGAGLGIGRAETTKDLTDLNGDGLPDLVRRQGSEIQVRWNLGDAFTAVWEPFGAVDSDMDEPLDHFQRNVEQGPLVSTANALGHETTISQNIAGGFSLLIVDFSFSKHQSTTRISRQLSDVNGDGLPDLLYKRPEDSFIRVQLNRGSDFAPMTTWTVAPWGGLLPAPSFADDIVSYLTPLQLTNSDVLGATGSQDSSSYHFGVHIPIPGTGISIDAGLGSSDAADTYELALLDVDGDGSADQVLRTERGENPGKIYVKKNLVTGKAHLLKTVKRPLGGSFTLDYERTAHSIRLPHSRQVLSTVIVDDGQDLGAGFESPNLVTRLSYEDGFYSRHEKEFFGFGKVTAKRADNVTFETTFENSTYALHGRALGSTRRDGLGRTFHVHATTYDVRAVLDGSASPVAADPTCVANLHPLLGIDACTPQFALAVREDDTQFEGGTASKTHVARDLAHDRFGNVLASIDEGDDTIASDDLYASATYQNDTARWILGRPTSLVARAGGASGAILRSRTGAYDVFGMPTSISVDTGSGVATTTLSYDGVGNLVHVESPPNETGQVQTFDVTFDAVTASYPVTVADGFGYTSTASYDLRFGIATSETDRAGATLERGLDAFGRLATVHGPYDTTAPGLSLTYVPDDVHPRAVTVSRPSAPPGYIGPVPTPRTSVVFVDGLGQAIEMRTTAVVAGVPGMTTSGIVARDAVGRVVSARHPFFDAGASTAFRNPAVTFQTTTQYDALDRPTRVTFPDAASETSSYALATAPGGGGLLLQTTSTDPNGHVRETYADLVGRTRAFVEHPSATASSVNRYDYLATGELSQIVDAEGNVTTLGYDLRGLRTSMSNPDTGLITDRFDAMGNHVGMTEPNHRAAGVEVKYRFDRDRLAGVDYPSKPDVTFTYGPSRAPTAPPNFATGRLTQVSDETGTQVHEYGALGELRRTIRTVVPAQQGSQSTIFDLRLTSDSFGRQLQIGYPDGEVVTNTYDAAGMLSSVSGTGTGWTQTYVTGLQYDEFGHRTKARFGNGVESTWSFEPARLRLASTTTVLPGSGSTKIQALQYSYDPGSNPTRIVNLLADLTGGSGNQPGKSTLDLTYDGVDRLTSAIASAQLTHQKTTTYAETFAYSASHNLTSKARVHQIIQQSGTASTPPATNFSSTYAYTSARPHLPSQIGDLAITYDPSGNPTTRQKVSTGSTQTLVWDDDGRMVDVIQTGGNQHMTYDASGIRVRRKNTQGDTIFSSPYFDLENSTQGVKHVFAGDMRVASKLGKFTSGTNPIADNKVGTAYFFHADHLGSTGVLTDASGAVVESLEYFVDGETWIDRAPQKPVNGYLFSGKPMDAATGFYDFGQRFYDPRTSVWLGIDPALTEVATRSISQPLVLSPLAFNAHSSWRYRDHDGREPSDAWNRPGCDAQCREVREAMRGLPDDLPSARTVIFDGSHYTAQRAKGNAFAGFMGLMIACGPCAKLMAFVAVTQAKNEGEAMSAAVGAMFAGLWNNARGVGFQAGAMARTGEGAALSAGTVARATKAIENRMRALGIPEEAIGILGKRGFNPAGSTVGGNVAGVGIEVDAAVFGELPGFSAWNKAKLSTRVDAVIAHEMEEFAGATHSQAVANAPNTSLPISEEARDLLRAMQQWEKAGGQ